jgi:hypothetical protein
LVKKPFMADRTVITFGYEGDRVNLPERSWMFGQSYTFQTIARRFAKGAPTPISA